MHPIDAICSRLLRAGYSLGEACFGSTWLVDLSKDGHRFEVAGPTHREAWRRALRLVEGLGVALPAAECEAQP